MSSKTSRRVEFMASFLLSISLLGKQFLEFVGRQPRLPYDGSQCARLNLPMSGNSQATKRMAILTQDHVAPGLMVNLIALPLESPDDLVAGQNRQFAHRVTSTNSSSIGGGTGSPCFSRLAM